jgi:predicted dehydrogenase
VYQWLQERIAAGVWGQVRAIWVQRPGIGLGCNATHSFDLAMQLTGATVERVTGWVDQPIKKNPRGEKFVDPGGLVVMELSGGARAIVTQIEDGAGPTSLEIHLTGARIYYDEGRGGLPVVVERDLSVARSPTQGAKFSEGVVPPNVVGKLDILGMIRGCLEHLVSDSWTNGAAQHGRAAVEVLVAAYLSHESGNQPVSLPLARREELELTLPVT